jgi:hypothetical protein
MRVAVKESVRSKRLSKGLAKSINGQLIYEQSFMSKPQEVKMAKKGLLLGMLALTLVLAGCASSAAGTGTSELVIQRKDGLMNIQLEVYVDGGREASLPYSRMADMTTVIAVPNGRHSVWVEYSGYSSEKITVRAASNRIVLEFTAEIVPAPQSDGDLVQKFTKISETALGN